MAVNKSHGIGGMNGTDHNIRREALPVRGNDSRGTRAVTLNPLNLPPGEHPAAIVPDDTDHSVGQRAAAPDNAEAALVVEISNKCMGIKWRNVLFTGIKRTDSRKNLPQRGVAHHTVDNLADALGSLTTLSITSPTLTIWYLANVAMSASLLSVCIGDDAATWSIKSQ